MESSRLSRRFIALLGGTSIWRRVIINQRLYSLEKYWTVVSCAVIISLTGGCSHRGKRHKIVSQSAAGETQPVAVQQSVTTAEVQMRWRKSCLLAATRRLLWAADTWYYIDRMMWLTNNRASVTYFKNMIWYDRPSVTPAAAAQARRWADIAVVSFAAVWQERGRESKIMLGFNITGAQWSLSCA